MLDTAHLIRIAGSIIFARQSIMAYPGTTQLPVAISNVRQKPLIKSMARAGRLTRGSRPPGGISKPGRPLYICPPTCSRLRPRCGTSFLSGSLRYEANDRDLRARSSHASAFSNPEPSVFQDALSQIATSFEVATCCARGHHHAPLLAYTPLCRTIRFQSSS